VDIYDSQSHEILVFEEHPITHNSASYWFLKIDQN
jgi:hypothetical protein